MGDTPLRVLRGDGGVPLAVALAGAGWYVAVRRGAGLGGAFAGASRFAAAAPFLQLATLTGVVAALPFLGSALAREVLTFAAVARRHGGRDRARRARGADPARSAGEPGMSERLSYAGLLLLVAIGGALAWTFALANRLDPDPSALASVPFEVAGWSGADVPVESDVENMLRADYNLQRAYEGPDGRLVWVYVGYYGTRRGGRPEHTPPTCYEANGYQIEEERTVAVDSASGLRVRELLVEMDGERRLAHFWYRAAGRTGILDGLGISLERLRRRFGDGRGDAALLRVSTVVEGPADLDPARARLAIFARFLDRAVAERWPDERAQGERQTASRFPSPAR